METKIERAIAGDYEPQKEAKAMFQKRKKTKAELVAREKELKNQLAAEQRTNPAAAIETRARLVKIQDEIKRLATESKTGRSLQQIRRSTAVASLALAADGVKPQK